jgi:hypothetical protein
VPYNGALCLCPQHQTLWSRCFLQPLHLSPCPGFCPVTLHGHRHSQEEMQQLVEAFNLGDSGSLCRIPGAGAMRKTILRTSGGVSVAIQISPPPRGLCTGKTVTARTPPPASLRLWLMVRRKGRRIQSCPQLTSPPGL